MFGLVAAGGGGMAFGRKGCAYLDWIYKPLLLQAGRIYRSWACLGVKDGGEGFGFDRGFVFKGGSSENPLPSLVTDMGNVTEVTYLKKSHILLKCDNNGLDSQKK